VSFIFLCLSHFFVSNSTSWVFTLPFCLWRIVFWFCFDASRFHYKEGLFFFEKSENLCGNFVEWIIENCDWTLPCLILFIIYDVVLNINVLLLKQLVLNINVC
jgi:hypothetical protein